MTQYETTETIINERKFTDLTYYVIPKKEDSSRIFLRGFVVHTVANKNSSLNSFCPFCLQIKYKGTEPIYINFIDRFFYSPSNQDCVVNKFHDAIPFYLNLTQLHKTVANSNHSFSSSSSSTDSSSKYSYIEIFLEMYNSADEKLGQSLIIPNTNILLDTEFLSKKGIKVSDISYFKLSMVIKEPCKINLNYFMFGFCDFMSTDTFYSEKFDVTVRLQVNNLKKKKNGVVIFFPSFYIKERDTDSINNNDNSVKWPNFTRYTWSRDLENFCTIFVADPFQYSKGNAGSSWFIAPNGESIIPEIASYIKSILDIKDNTEQENNLDFRSLFSISQSCGPIINYGSSMGGYAAFLFSCYLKPELCFCECPQANLLKYKYSKEYLDNCENVNLKDNSLDLSFSSILRNHHPKFRSLIHFYSLDKLHLSSFEKEIQSLTDEELKTFNYQLIIENDIENQLFSHQAMPKDKVLEIFKTYLSKKR
ncbi:MAG: hypothetical protein ACI4V7_10645 [Succinivibrionaceae bacterium]